MKILMVNKFLYPKGGAETYFLKIGNYLQEHGHEVQYFGMYDDKNTMKNNAGQYTKNVDFHNAGIEKVLYPFKIIYSRDAKKKLKKVIEDFKPDIIHMNNINFQLTPSIIDAAYEENVPVVQTVHDYQMICPNHLLFNPNTNQICEKCIKGSKWNCTKGNCIHGSKVKSILGSVEGILYTKYRDEYKKVNKFICPSYFLENKLLSASDIYKGKTIAIHNFIELKPLNSYTKDNYVLFFGRLSEEKGLKMFLECCKELPNIKFKVAGTGPLDYMCKGIDNVEFVGFKTGKELEELIARAKFSVYPSIWYENCPLSILESESLGTPVITAKNGGMMELVEDKETGILVENINKENLKKAIEDLYSNDSLIEKMSKSCIAKRDKMISLEQYCDKLLKIYDEVLEGAKK